MKPGVERDKVVAELRGDKPDIICHLPTEADCPYYGHVGEEDCPDKCEYLKPDYKPYSTDIACAFELWEEMKGAIRNSSASVLRLNIDTISYLICCTVLESHMGKPSKLGKCLAETEADAISGAWLKWKS